MADGTKQGVQLGFFSNAFKDSKALQLIGVRGKERISQLFEFDLLLTRKGPALTEDELQEIVRQPCVVALGRREADLVHGILVAIEHLDGARHVHPTYVARMVPQVALLGMGERCGVYAQMTIPKMVEEILRAHGLAAGTDLDIMVTNDAKSPTREYVVQYRESDWAFIQRWLEHEGFFYWFEHSRTGAKLVIADENSDASPLADPQAISYRERNNLVTEGEATIWDFTTVQRRVPQRVTVLDYNYRRPADLLVSSEVIDEGGFGHVIHYGEHVKDRDVSGAMAKLRAQLHAAERRVVRGTTDCSRFRVGHVFTLENHHVEGYNGDYLIISVDHVAGLGFAGIYDVDRRMVDEQPHHYKATFSAVPTAVQYRPERRTPWPRVSGLINGHIEADTAGDYAQIDEQGRYKVKMPFDIGNRKGLSSSRWIRMAQSYAGAGYGQHFPLHKGTEVIIGHIDGDPDRPIIVGSVPNPATSSPVADANATQSVTQTASGIRVEYEDLQQ